LKATAVDKSDRLPTGETDVFELRREGASLTAIVRPLLDQTVCVEVSFPNYHVLLEADEGDLARHWGSGQFKSGHTVYEILDGGFLSAMKSGPAFLFITPALPNVREWFIATSGVCVTVLSESAPQIRMTRGA
jgi:hypothetical protein